MKASTRFQLSAMMFLEFFIWGAWAVSLGSYLGKTLHFTGADIGKAYSTTAWAAIISPFFVGLIADRFFSAEKVLAVMHLLGAVAMFYASKVTSPGTFFWVLLVYALCYMPTLALTNAVAFHQMDNPSRQFPAIRVWGTLGWIAVGWVIGLCKIDAAVIPLLIAAGASAVMGLFCFTLPNTPPKGAGQAVRIRDILGLDALGMMKDGSFATFIISSLLICIPLAFYYSFANLFFTESGVPWPTATQTLGQISEVFFMVIMPLFFIRLGVKKMLLVGMLAWTARYVCFAYGSAHGALLLLVLLGIAMHGVCYDFFFVTGQIYTDNKAPGNLRASAQGFLTLITQGVGMLIGNNIAGMIADSHAIKDNAGTIINHAWRPVWLIPAAMALVIAILYAMFFRDHSPAASGQSIHTEAKENEPAGVA